MAAPRLDIDLDKIYHNTHELVTRLAEHGISVMGVTKVALGSEEIANAMLQAGVNSLGDSRIENIKFMRRTEMMKNVWMTLIRSPMLSQVEQVVTYADMSFNTEIEIIKRLSIEAQKQGCIHQIILMVELGDLREGIMPDDLFATVGEVLGLPNIVLKGIGTNLACRSGVSPDANNMSMLSELVDRIEATFDLKLDLVSGGNSANIDWVLSDPGTSTGRVNNLRLGEAILLGCETLHSRPIDGLHQNAITLVAEVIELKLKPSQPSGDIAQTAFGEATSFVDRGIIKQAILAIGRQDIDPSGLLAPEGIEILGASSDHLIVDSASDDLVVGQEMTFGLNYSALIRAMTSPFVSKNFRCRDDVSLAYYNSVSWPSVL